MIKPKVGDIIIYRNYSTEVVLAVIEELDRYSYRNGNGYLCEEASISTIHAFEGQIIPGNAVTRMLYG